MGTDKSDPGTNQNFSTCKWTLSRRTLACKVHCPLHRETFNPTALHREDGHKNVIARTGTRTTSLAGTATCLSTATDWASDGWCPEDAQETSVLCCNFADTSQPQTSPAQAWWAQSTGCISSVRCGCGRLSVFCDFECLLMLPSIYAMPSPSWYDMWTQTHQTLLQQTANNPRNNKLHIYIELNLTQTTVAVYTYISQIHYSHEILDGA